MLKSLGASYSQIRMVILYQSGFLISKGLLFGNIIGILLCILQHFFKIIPLNADSYFLEYVPINLSLLPLLLLNFGTMMLVLVAQLLPALAIVRINPAQTIKFH